MALIVVIKKKRSLLKTCFDECELQVFLFCLYVFNGPVNNEVMSSRSVNSGTVPGQA